MLYIMLGLVVAVAAVGTLLRRQHSKRAHTPAAGTPEGAPGQSGGEAGAGTPLTAAPISSPNAVVSATYGAAAPAGLGDDSPYSYGASEDSKKKGKAAPNLLRWCGRSSSIQVGDFAVLSPVAYWSNGASSVPEPSCIDVTLPVEYPQEGTHLPADGAVSYREMTPLQRGIYLTWLAGGRIQPPLHPCYPSIWLYGIERRSIVDKLDLGLCIGESFRMLPLMRWEVMASNLIQFITWLAVKIWLPEEELLNFCKRLLTIPDGLLGMLLGSYANSKLPLPSVIAFTLMRASASLRKAALGDEAPQIPHSDDLVRQFTPLYKEACKGGVVIGKPKNKLSVKYTPTNPSLAEAGDKVKKEIETVLELPNFFEDLGDFQPLIEVWKGFAEQISRPRVETAAAVLEERPDFEGFIASLRPEGSDAPLLSTLTALGELMKADAEQEKPKGRDRKAMVDTAQVEGYQILPNLGLSGREYHWEDKILFLPLDLGAQLSTEYYAASFLLEFLCSITGAREQRSFEQLRQRLNDYFVLSTDDNVRLEAQSRLNLPAPYPPEYYGELIQVWFQDEENRAVLRNFILDALSFLSEAQLNPETLRTKVCGALGITADTPPLPKDQPTAERGTALLKILAPFFKV